MLRPRMRRSAVRAGGGRVTSRLERAAIPHKARRRRYRATTKVTAAHDMNASASRRTAAGCRPARESSEGEGLCKAGSRPGRERDRRACPRRSQTSVRETGTRDKHESLLHGIETVSATRYLLPWICFQRTITALYCSLAFVTASTCLSVGATSAVCIDIAAAIITARTLSSVGDPLAD